MGSKKRKDIESLASSSSIDTFPNTMDREKKKRPAGETSVGKDLSIKKRSSNVESNDETIRHFREQHQIKVSGPDTNNPFGPCLLFEDPRLPRSLVECLCGSFDRPTPIQAECWPIILASHDLIGIAKTGSGKTLAYGLPALDLCLKSPARQLTSSQHSRNGVLAQPKVLVVVPTRELAIQIEGVLDSSKMPKQNNRKPRVLSVYGGIAKDVQRNKFLQLGGIDILIATPGRLCDLIDDKSCDLSYVEFVVLDEADRMLDLGFDRDIRTIMNLAGKSLDTMGADVKSRQTLMFSATWPSEVRDLALRYLNAPITVTLGGDVSQATANTDVKQIVDVVQPREKDYLLETLLTNYHRDRKNRILIFVLYKKEAIRLEVSLQRKGWNARAIHGDMNQPQRIQVIDQFRCGTVPLLVATDVVSRGLDIPNVEYVINYTFPLTIEDYVHRIGRTARAGSTGIAHSFFTELDKAHAGELAGVLLKAGQVVPESLSKFGLHIKKKKHHIYGDFYREVPQDEATTPTQKIHIKFED